MSDLKITTHEAGVVVHVGQEARCAMLEKHVADAALVTGLRVDDTFSKLTVSSSI